MTGPSVYLHFIGFKPGLLASIRMHLKNYNFSNFAGLLDSLEQIDRGRQQVVSRLNRTEYVGWLQRPLDLCPGWGAIGLAGA